MSQRTLWTSACVAKPASSACAADDDFGITIPEYKCFACTYQTLI